MQPAAARRELFPIRVLQSNGSAQDSGTHTTETSTHSKGRREEGKGRNRRKSSRVLLQLFAEEVEASLWPWDAPPTASSAEALGIFWHHCSSHFMVDVTGVPRLGVFCEAFRVAPFACIRVQKSRGAFHPAWKT